MGLVIVSSSTQPSYSAHDIANAYHEAGHVVVIIHEGFTFLSKPITIRDSDGGATTPWKPGDIVERASAAQTARARYDILKPKLLVDFAGGYAEVKKTGRGGAANDGIHDDMQRSVKAFVGAVTPCFTEERKAWMAEAEQSAGNLIDSLWPAVVAIAEALLILSKISGAEAKKFYDTAINPPASARPPTSTPQVSPPLASAAPPRRGLGSCLLRFFGRR
ncbi:MAG: hypothetical protein WCI94_19745 [Rhodospirillales bacterium]